jgi:hypothetical protein
VYDEAPNVMVVFSILLRIHERERDNGEVASDDFKYLCEIMSHVLIT